MHDLEQRFHRAVGSLIGNESLIISLDENAAGELFAWAEAITRKIVQDTIGLDDEAAESRLAPRLRALRLMVRALARWVGEFHVLDEQARLSLWARIGEQARLVLGESFTLPPMSEVVAELPPQASAQQILMHLKTLFDVPSSKG